MDKLIEVYLKESKPDFASGQYKVILQDKNSPRILSIWVGHFEGNAIALGLEQAWTPRPMTHDLIINMLDSTKTQVNRVVITDLRENTFYAVIDVHTDEEDLLIDSRPSDALAIAVRLQAPIFVSEKLVEKMVDELDELFEKMEPQDTVH